MRSSYIRKSFYVLLVGIFPLFFLLHWNGMFSITYYWALEAVGGTRSFLPQVSFSFVSALVIFAGIALVFEAGMRGLRAMVEN